MPVRKSATRLTQEERDSLLAAVVRMKANITNPDVQEENQISVFDQFEAVHLACLNVKVPDGSNVNMGHQGPAFLPWHREFLLWFENELVAHGSSIGLPYWDWTDHEGTNTKLFTDEYLGARDGEIQRGYFAYHAPETDSNSFSKPEWWPDTLEGWRIKESLSHEFGTTLRREYIDRPLAVPEDVRRTMARNTYEDRGTMIETDPVTGRQVRQPRGFRNRLELGNRMHNFGHGWVGGHMGHPYTSPNDLIFFFHHCNIDRLWAEWQKNGHEGIAYYPSDSSGEDEGHKLNDPMWPWVGDALGYVPSKLFEDAPTPDFSSSNVRTAADVMDMSSLGYVYE